MEERELTQLRHTCLYGEHVALGARMVPFAGWEMPTQYKGVIKEHYAVRQRAGMFDVSHMGRLEVHGRKAAAFLRHVCTWDITRLNTGQGHYCLMCNEEGGILDDVYVFCLTEERYLVVVNAANAGNIYDHLRPAISKREVRLVNRHQTSAMIAVQGPTAAKLLTRAFGKEQTEPVLSLKKRHCIEVELILPNTTGSVVAFFSRTGYTGEDGIEVIVPVSAAGPLWRVLQEAGVQPCGLGARDTLRLEAALALYGNDIDEATNPYEAGLDWTVALDDSADFIGRNALLRIRGDGVGRQLTCIAALGREVMRAGYPIRHSGKEISTLTSGGFSPTLRVSIGMAYLPLEINQPGTKLEVDVRGRPLKAQVVKRPFYRRPAES